jgi:DNA repair exonuclease SbcCD ATPase subunit
MATQIIRHDRGLDSKRIEKIIEMIQGKINSIKYDSRDVLQKRKEELKQEFIAQNNLQPHYDAIEDINRQIKELQKQIDKLEKQKDPHKLAIARLMRGYEETYYYDSVEDGSPADEYIKARIPDIDGMKKQLTELSEEIEEKLWLAKDIDEARMLYDYALRQIDAIVGETKR